MGMMMNYMMAMGSFDQKKFSTKTNVLAGQPVLGDRLRSVRRLPEAPVMFWSVLANRPWTRHHRLV
jgi:hypothetical protein